MSQPNKFLKYGKTSLFYIVYLVLLGVIWQGLVTIMGIPYYVLPTPIDVFTSLADKITFLMKSSVTTIEETVAGFGIGAVGGVAIALMISYSSIVKRALYPLVIAFQSIPKAAIAPLFIIWFGIGLYSKVMMAFAIAFFPVVIDTISGLEKIDPDLLDVLTAMKATKTQIFRKIRLPHSLPYMFDGFKIALPLSLVGAIIGEFIASQSGLGYIILQTAGTGATSLMFAALIMVTIISLILYGIILVVEPLIIRWQPERK